MTKISRRKSLTLLGATSASIMLTPTISFASDNLIVCNWDNDFPPYSMERNGKMTGILVECMDEIVGRRMGYTLKHKGYAWPEAQKKVRSGNGDSLCTNPTDERKKYMYFSEEAVVESLPSIFCAVDNPRRSEIDAITDLAGLKGFRQVDYKGNGWAAKTFPPDLDIRYVNDLQDVFRMLSRGEADIFVGNGLAAMYIVKQTGLKNKIHARELPVGEPSSFHFGLRNNYPEAKKIMKNFETALEEAMLDNETRKIIMNYL